MFSALSGLTKKPLEDVLVLLLVRVLCGDFGLTKKPVEDDFV